MLEILFSTEVVIALVVLGLVGAIWVAVWVLSEDHVPTHCTTVAVSSGGRLFYCRLEPGHEEPCDVTSVRAPRPFEDFW